MIELLRGHLISDKNLIQLLNNKESIFYIEKPEKVKVTDYILIRDKLISDKYIATYQIEFRVYSKDLNKAIDIEKELISYLNDPRGEKIIKDENNNYIRNISVLNGGGTAKDEEGNWIKVVFFLLKK